MNEFSSRLQALPRWARFVGVWILWMLLCAPQTRWPGGEARPWPDVFWIQINFWTPWAILSLGIFKLCEGLYSGPHTLRRYVPALLFGAVAAALLDPLLENALFFGEGWVKAWLGFSPEPPSGFLSKVGVSALKGSGTNPFMFVVIAIAWLAWRYGRDLQEKQVNSLELESRLRQAQLQVLRSQLNPHFLFNTLHSIAELVHQNPPLAEKLILRLGELLREALAASGEPEIALAEELKFIKAYLDIEQMRLGNRLKLVWDVADDVLKLKVPSFVLQPLVENAIQHGIAAFSQPGELRIGAKRDADFLHLQVRDSGPGLAVQDHRTNDGIGLANTRDRLRTIYGSNHEFRLTNQNGLTVDLRLPLTCSNDD